MTLTSVAAGAVRYVPAPFLANAVSEGVKAAHTGMGNALAGIFDILLAEEEGKRLDNPMFTQNGHEGPSPGTERYLQSKKSLGVLGGFVTSLYDLGGVADGLRAAHTGHVWYKVNALFNKMVPPSRRAKKVVYANWYSWEVARKAVSRGSLEAQMTRILRQKMYSSAGSASKAAVAFGSGGMVGYFVNSATSTWQEQLDAVFGQDVQTLAQGLHWFAFLEMVVDRVVSGGYGKGPALRILDLLWNELAVTTGATAQVTLKQIVREPKGWLVIADLIK